MSSFKRLKKPDVFVIPKIVHKSWEFEIEAYNCREAGFYVTICGGQKNPQNRCGVYNYETEEDLYNLMNHMYYQYYSGSLLLTHSLMLTTENYMSASTTRPSEFYLKYNLEPSFEEYFPTSSGDMIQVLSISREVYGTKVVPGTFHYSSSTVQMHDDEKGHVFISDGTLAGNIYYGHGIVIISHPAYQSHTYPFTITFDSEWTIYEHYISCTIKEHEMNLTYNPSLLQNPVSATGSVQDFATGSVFTPYATTIGIYNDNNDLLMVAKLSQPIPISSETDQTFLIRYDKV